MIKPVRKLHRLVAHDFLIIALWLTYFYIHYVGRKLLFGHKITKLQNYKLNLVSTGQKPLSSDDNSPDRS